jgi:hypothetical protein
MTLNHKQEELIRELVRDIEAQFPDTRFVQVSPSPESERTLWLEFTKPADDDRMLDIIEYAGPRAMDILLDYGYHMLVMPAVENETAEEKIETALAV